MGICKKCGQPLQDGQRFCNICGTENDAGFQSEEQTVLMPNAQAFNPQPQGQPGYNQPAGQSGYNQPTGQPGYNQPMGQPAYNQQAGQAGYNQPQYNQPQGGYGQQGAYNQQNMYNQPVGGQPIYSQPQVSGTKAKKSKKGLVIGIVSLLAVAAVALVLIFVVLPKQKVGKKAAEKKVKSYFEYINDLDAEKLIDATISKGMIKKIADEYGDMSESEKKEFEENLDKEYKNMVEELQKQIDSADVKIDCTDVKVGDIEKADVKKIINSVFDSLGSKEYAGYDADEVYDAFVDGCKKLDIDIDKIYQVDVKFDCKVTVNGESTVSGIDIGSMIPMYLDHMFTYVYDGDTYVVPGIDKLLQLGLSKYLNKIEDSGFHFGNDSNTDSTTSTQPVEPIEIPTEAPTEEPIEIPTEAPTEEPIEIPTEAPTEEPIEIPTEAPIEIPSETINYDGTYKCIEIIVDGQTFDEAMIDESGQSAILTIYGDKCDLNGEAALIKIEGSYVEVTDAVGTYYGNYDEFTNCISLDIEGMTFTFRKQ